MYIYINKNADTLAKNHEIYSLGTPWTSKYRFWKLNDFYNFRSRESPGYRCHGFQLMYKRFYL